MPEDKYVNELVSAIAKLRALAGAVPADLKFGDRTLYLTVMEAVHRLEVVRRREVILKRFCHYSFEDIHYEYKNLTEQEKGLCTEQEFQELMLWLRSR